MKFNTRSQQKESFLSAHTFTFSSHRCRPTHPTGEALDRPGVSQLTDVFQAAPLLNHMSQSHLVCELTTCQNRMFLELTQF